MGIYYFAVDYNRKLQMWSPKNFDVKSPGIFYPGNPFPCMVIMKNIQGFDFEIVNDVSTYDEHSFENVTEKVYNELKEKFPYYNWDRI